MTLWLDDSLTYGYGVANTNKEFMYFVPKGEMYWAKPLPAGWKQHWKTSNHPIVYDQSDRLDLVKLELITKYDTTVHINPPVIPDKLSGMNVWKDMYYGFRLPKNDHGCQYLIFDRKSVQELPYDWKLRTHLLKGHYTSCAKNSCGRLIYLGDSDLYCKLHSKKNSLLRKESWVAP